MGLGCMRLRAKAAALGVCIGCVLLMSRVVSAQQDHLELVRVAEIEVDLAQLDAYKAELRREIEASIRLEHGVLALYAVAVTGKPNQIRLFAIIPEKRRTARTFSLPTSSGTKERRRAW